MTNTAAIIAALDANNSRGCLMCHGTGIRPDQTFPVPCDDSCPEKVRKNGTCAYHACYRCNGAGKLSPRTAFMQRLNAGIGAAYTDESRDGWETLRRFVFDNAKAVSHTAQWQEAVTWFGPTAHDAETDPKWIVIQGSVYLAHAC